MFFRKKQKPARQPMPPWMKWAAVIFLGLAFIGNMRNAHNPNAPEPIPRALSTAAQNLNPKKLLPIDTYKSVLFSPHTVPASTLKGPEILEGIKEIMPGEGTPAICGQEAKISYKTYDKNDKPVGGGQTLTFHIGEDKEFPALEQGIVGMKKGGKRMLISTTRHFEAELLDTTPPLPDIDATPYRITIITAGDGPPAILCEKQGKFEVTLWSTEGKKLFTSKDKPITFTPGKSEVFLGLEQGVIGMKQGEMRTLVVPPAFQKTMNGNPPAIDFPLPRDQTVLVDVKALP